MTNCTTTPLLDLLRAVPADARVIYQHSLTDCSIIPAGRLCHEAAAEIARLTAERARIIDAPTAIIDTRDVLGLCAPDEAPDAVRAPVDLMLGLVAEGEE